MAERGDVDGNGIPGEKYDFNRIEYLLNLDFPTTIPGSRGALFHDSFGQDDWRNDSSGIKHFHIFGVQKKFDTTDGLYIYKSIKCRLSGNTLTGCFKNRLYVPKKGGGDKTVPLISTSMGWIPTYINIPVHDLAPPGMRIFRRQSLSRSTDAHAEHTGLTQDEKVRALIAYILAVGQQPSWTDELYELTRPGSSGSLVHENLTEYSPAHYLTILGQTEIAVRDQAGNTAAIENGFLRNDVPGLSSYEMIADDSVLLIFATGDNYTAEFRAGTTAMGIELIKGIGNENPDSVVRYNNLDFPPQTKMRLTFSQDGVVELRVDADSDGTFETLVPPTANLSGAAAADVEPPTVNITLTKGQGDTAIARINASDFGSGVNKIWYSVDGENFNPFTAPFSITLSSTPITIEAFSDDNAANRSGLVSKTVRLAPTVIPIAECMSLDEEGYHARFGYQNQTAASVLIPVGPDNMFFPSPGNRGQSTNFQTGNISAAFTVRTHKKKTEWQLRGPDGLLRVAAALIGTTPACP